MKPSPSPSGTGGSGADPAAAYPARDLAQSLSAFANINFQAEKDMLENAGAHPFPDPRARSRSRRGRRRPTRARVDLASPSASRFCSRAIPPTSVAVP